MEGEQEDRIFSDVGDESARCRIFDQFAKPDADIPVLLPWSIDLACVGTIFMIAGTLLRYSNSSIEEIAHLCGIDDASYFNKVFRKMEGCTASEYRKRW